MMVLAPTDAFETRTMTLAAANEPDGPVYLRLGQYPAPYLHSDDYVFQVRRAAGCAMIQTGLFLSIEEGTI